MPPDPEQLFALRTNGGDEYCGAVIDRATRELRWSDSAGDLTAGLSVITLVALVESKYQIGFALSFWEYLTIPIGILMSLTGYCTYRFRETRSLSIGQFLEMRYSKPLRVASVSRT